MSRSKLYLTLPVMLLAGCYGSQPEATLIASLELENPSSFARADEATILNLDDLGVVDEQPIRVESDAGEIPSQLSDTDGDGDADSLLFVTDFAAAGTRHFSVVNGAASKPVVRTQAEVSVKEGGEWDGKVYRGGEFVNVAATEPPPQYTDHSEYIRYEGPGIESEMVAYRFYLDWRNGFDIFGKTKHELVLHKVGLDGYDSYHDATDWGLDILKVGDAVGIGGYGYWDGEKIVRVSDTASRSTSIIESGPLSSALEISYKDWKAADYTTDLDAHLSMTAGSRMVRVKLKADPGLPNIAIGIVRHPDAETIHGEVNISGHIWTYVATWGPQALVDGNLGLALFFKKHSRIEQTGDEHNQVSVMQLGDGRLEYYFASAWSKEPDGIKSRDDFVAWLEQEAEKLTMPIRTRIRTAATDVETSRPIDAVTALRWSSRLADAEIERLGRSLQLGGFDSDRNMSSQWAYTTGLLAQAMDDLSLATGDSRYSTWAKATIDSYIADNGDIRSYDASLYNIDDVNSGKMLLRYLERTGDDRYLAAAESIRAQLADHPRTSEGAFWHKSQYPWQLWLDGTYMAMPFLAHYAQLHDDPHSLEEAVAELQLAHLRLRDTTSGLYYHAWDEKAEQGWADTETGLSSFFWSRGMGWYGMALVDVLDFVPIERQDLRESIITIIREFADAILAQRHDGVWYQISNLPDAAGNYPEASGSSMFVYTLAKAVNKGYLDASYRPAAIESYTAVVTEFVNVSASGRVSLKNVCMVAGLGYGRDGSYRYYTSEPVVNNDPKGVGPFIMAGVEISKLFDN